MSVTSKRTKSKALPKNDSRQEEEVFNKLRRRPISEFIGDLNRAYQRQFPNHPGSIAAAKKVVEDNHWTWEDFIQEANKIGVTSKIPVKMLPVSKTEERIWSGKDSVSVGRMTQLPE